MSEEWRAIPGWEGFYEVSSRGRVRSITRLIPSPLHAAGRVLPGRFLKMPPNKDGYPNVTLHRDGRQATHLVHVLVLRAFVGQPPFPRAHGRHLNDAPADNRLENLAWGTAAENSSDAVKNGRTRRGSTCAWARLNEEVVKVIRRTPAAKTNLLASLFKVSPSLVYQIRTSRRWRHVEVPCLTS